MHAQNNRPLRVAVVAVVALIVTSAVSLAVVLSHEDTAMAQGKPWPSKPATTSSSSASASSAASASTSAAAAAPVTTPAATPTPTTQTSPVAQNSQVSTDGKKSPANRAPLTYTVKKGDNLTVIADWFKLHGYGDLYERNRKTIGSDPDLIRPGQKITVSSAGASTSR